MWRHGSRASQVIQVLDGQSEGRRVPTPYDVANPDPHAARLILFNWLRAHPTGQLDRQGDQYLPFVEVVGQPSARTLAFHLSEVFWELVVEGIVAPGMNAYNLDLPWYHLTAYGHRVLGGEPAHPHDEEAYLLRVRGSVAAADATVMAYLSESVRAFRRATPVASVVMLGIAAERVFLLLCDALVAAIRDPAERAAFQALVDRFAMKPKLDWAHAKVQDLQNRRVPGLPDNATLAVTAIYDLLRSQRNDLGHPREEPPAVDRAAAFANLQVFPHFYQTADALCAFFRTHQV